MRDASGYQGYHKGYHKNEYKYYDGYQGSQGYSRLLTLGPTVRHI